MRAAPAWVEDAIWWQVYPLGFVGAEKVAPNPLDVSDEDAAGRAVHHRLPDAAWLDYLTDLGCNGLVLGPVFASETHGYDTIDFLRIDPRLGDSDDFDRLAGACRERGIRLVLDGVFNHVGRDHPRFVQAMQDGVGSEAGGWFHLSDDGGEVRAQSFEGHDQLVTLNHANPAVVDHVVEVMCHWLERGADGWRLDAAYAVPAEFWAQVLPRVRERFGDAWFVAEMIQGDYMSYLDASTIDSVTQYELWKAIWSSLNDGNFYELDWTLSRHNELLAPHSDRPTHSRGQGVLPMTFVGNHDVTRLASMLKDPRHLVHAYALLFFLGGTPSIYYGDERAAEGIKEERFGGDDAIRPAFPETPAALGDAGWDTYHLHQQLIGLRRRHPWLARATSEVLHLANQQLALAASDPAGPQRLVLLLNPADSDIQLDLDLGRVEVLEHSPGSRVGELALAPYGWGVLTVHPD